MKTTTLKNENSHFASPGQLKTLRRQLPNLPEQVANRLDPKSPTRLSRREATLLSMTASSPTAGKARAQELLLSGSFATIADRDLVFPVR